MLIREYQPLDCKELAKLFYNTVHTVNTRDYTKEQLDVWATGQIDLEKWNQSFQQHYSVVAVDDKIIVGFGDIDETGYLDRLFVHALYQGKGIAANICNQLEQAIQGNIVTHASITARPFFEKRGYKVIPLLPFVLMEPGSGDFTNRCLKVKIGCAIIKSTNRDLKGEICYEKVCHNTFPDDDCFGIIWVSK